MKPVALEDTTIHGDLAFRAAGNFRRLHEDKWHPDRLFMPRDYEWPADMEGRTILALVCLARTLNQKPEYLDTILARLPGLLNKRGYLGPVLPEGVTDEQVLSGHSWMLRGLLEHYQWTGSARSLDMARGIVEGLFLPATEAYPRYPLRPVITKDAGEAIGARPATRKKDGVCPPMWGAHSSPSTVSATPARFLEPPG